MYRHAPVGLQDHRQLLLRHLLGVRGFVEQVAVCGSASRFEFAVNQLRSTWWQWRVNYFSWSVDIFGGVLGMALDSCCIRCVHCFLARWSGRHTFTCSVVAWVRRLGVRGLRTALMLLLQQRRMALAPLPFAWVSAGFDFICLGSFCGCSCAGNVEAIVLTVVLVEAAFEILWTSLTSCVLRHVQVIQHKGVQSRMQLILRQQALA